MATHTPSEEEREAMEEADLKWPCYECNRKFKTSTLLQKHLTVHDENVAGIGDDDDNYEGEKRTMKRPRRRLKGLKGKKKGRPAKKIRVSIECNCFTHGMYECDFGIMYNIVTFCPAGNRWRRERLPVVEEKENQHVFEQVSIYQSYLFCRLDCAIYQIDALPPGLTNT